MVDTNTAIVEATPAASVDLQPISTEEIGSTLTEIQGTAQKEPSTEAKDTIVSEAPKAIPEGQDPEWITRLKTFKPDTDLKDPAQVQKATWELYRELEKKATPVMQEHDELLKYKESTKDLDDLVKWINADEKRAETTREFVEELRQEELRQKYGENLPKEVLEELQRAKLTGQRLDQIEKQSKEKSEDEALDKALGEAKSFATEKKIDFNESEVLDYMEKNAIWNPTAAVKAMNFDKALLNSKKETETATLKKIQENSRSGVIKVGGETTPVKPKTNEHDDILKDIDEMYLARERIK